MTTRSAGLEAYAGGLLGGPGSLADPTLIETMRQYRTEVAKRYRALGPEQLEGAIVAGKVWMSTKLDGELWFLVKRGDDVFACSPNGRVLQSTPLLREAAAQLASEPDALFAGELVATPPEGRARVQHVAAALKHDELEPRLSLRLFDIVRDGDQDVVRMRYAVRLERLRALFGAGKRVGVVTTVEGDSKEVPAYYREWVAAQGFEGIVVRSEIGIVYKAKPALTIDAVVIAFGTRAERGATVVREITVALRRDDGTLHVLGSVGGGFSEEDRVQWLDRLSELEVPSRFRMANRDGALCRFVRPQIVVEIQCTDLIETDANDLPIARMTLTYSEGSGYAPSGEARIAAMLFPRFVRERTDKVPDVAGVGITQVTRRLALDDLSGSLGTGPLAASEVVHRAVFTKGDTAVRKVAVIETHKQPHQGYAPFVVHGTDFSAGRAEPLKTTLRTASTRERADAFVAAWMAENVKRGWAPFVATESPATSGTAQPTEAQPETGAADDLTRPAGTVRKARARTTAAAKPDLAKATPPAAKRKRRASGTDEDK
ncbi:MAG: ATP-dependent DNA ligase [Polyangiaceae bacterium]|nr:ATP-dependent DNA ligase [Polyangiaceae bacterium]